MFLFRTCGFPGCHVWSLNWRWWSTDVGVGGALCVEARTPSPSRAPGDCLPSFFLGAYTRDGVDSWRVGFLQMWMERVSWQPGTSAGTGQACAQRPVVKSRVWPALGWRCFLWPLGKGWWWLPGSQVPVPGLDVSRAGVLGILPLQGRERSLAICGLDLSLLPSQGRRLWRRLALGLGTGQNLCAWHSCRSWHELSPVYGGARLPGGEARTLCWWRVRRLP